MSIYQNLYRYRPAEKRNPLEDFITEALIDFLNRLPNALQLDFVMSVLLNGVNLSKWQPIIAHFDELGWSSQKTITQDGGRYRLDILLESRGRAILVVESKIASTLRRYRKRGDVEDTELEPRTEEVTNQLQHYGRWLSGESRPEGWPGALIYLTRSEPAPDQFGLGDVSTFGVPIQVSCRWHHVARWLSRLADALRSEANKELKTEMPLLASLAAEFCTFLRRYGMSGDTFTLNDVTVYDLYFQSSTRVENSFVSLGQAAEEAFGAEGRTKVSELVEEEPGLIWQFFYLTAPFPSKKNEWFFAWGFYFPNHSSRWRDATPKLPNTPYFFLCLGSDSDKNKIPITASPLANLSSWSTLAQDTSWLVCGKPIASFAADEPQPVTDMASWLRSKVDELKSYLASTRSTV